MINECRKLVMVSSGMTWSFLAEKCQGDRYTFGMWQELIVSGSCPVVGFGITAIICSLPDAFTSKQVNYTLWVGKIHTYNQEQKDTNDTYQELSFLVRRWWRPASLYQSRLHLFTNLHIMDLHTKTYQPMFSRK
jgi:hypothetical protein